MAHAPDAFGDVAARDGGTGDVGDVVIEFEFGAAVFGLKLFTPTGAPHFIVSALRDPGSEAIPSRPLQRLEIVKGWLENGEHREQVYAVAGGDNGASVDLATCEPRGEGANSLCTVWTDPDFDATSPAFYYTRVFENPTCRWSQSTCNAAGVDCSDPATVPEGLSACCEESHKGSIQERAWTSPIWYTPG